MTDAPILEERAATPNGAKTKTKPRNIVGVHLTPKHLWTHADREIVAAEDAAAARIAAAPKRPYRMLLDRTRDIRDPAKRAAEITRIASQMLGWGDSEAAP